MMSGVVSLPWNSSLSRLLHENLKRLLRNPDLAENLDVFAKDRSQDLLVFLKDLFNPKTSAHALRNSSLALSATLGTQSMCHLVLENVSKIGIKSQFNATVLYDLLAQGDLLHNTSWLQVLISFVKLMQLKSAFKFILPGSLHSHNAGIKMSKNAGVVRTIRTHAIVASSTLHPELQGITCAQVPYQAALQFKCCPQYVL